MSNYNFTSAFFGGFSSGSSFSGLLGEYNSIKNGSYRRLLKSYYGKYNADGTAKSTTKTERERKPKTSSDTMDSAKSLTSVSEKATALQNAATKLSAVKEGTSSIYAKKTLVEKKDGITTTRTDYDYDTVTSAVKSLVTAYNETLDEAAKVGSASVQNKAKWMMSVTAQYKDQLSEFGISVDKEGRLSLDEKVFRGREMPDIQDFFEGSNSFTSKIARKASSLSGAADLQATRAASAYTPSGNTYKPESMNSGTVFDSLF